MNKLQSSLAAASSVLALGGAPYAVAQQVSTTLGAGSPAAATVTRTSLPQSYPIPDKSETKNFADNTILTYTISLDDQVANLQPGEQKHFNISASPEGIPANSTCTADSLTKTITYQKAQLAQAIQVPTLSSAALGTLALLIVALAYRRKKIEMPMILAAVAAAGMILPPDTIAAIADPNTVRGSASAGLKSMKVVLDGMKLTITVEANGDCTIEIPPTNTAPTANADTATVDAGSSVDISVLANDTDPDQNTLSIGAFTQPAHGTVTKVGKILRYTPTAGYSGRDTFTYYAYDGTTTSLTPATVTVNVLAPANVPSNLTFLAPTVTKEIGEIFTQIPSSNNPTGAITYVSSDPAKAAVNATTGTVTAIAAGSVTITANQAASPGFLAGNESYTFNILAPLTKVSENLPNFELTGSQNKTGTITVSRNVSSSVSIQAQFIDASNNQPISGGSIAPLTNGTNTITLNYVTPISFGGRNIKIRLTIGSVIIETNSYDML